MKKLFLLLLFPLSVFGAMDATLGTNCDNEAASIITAIQTAETNYAAAHNGRFFSLPGTSDTYPADGVKVTPDATAWTAAGITLPATVYQYYQLDEYVGAQGNGWALHRIVKSSGTIYEKEISSGPESGWTKATWTQRDR